MTKKEEYSFNELQDQAQKSSFMSNFTHGKVFRSNFNFS